MRTKLEFDCHLIQLKPLFVFFKTPYKVLGIISKHLAFILQVKCKQTFITLSLYIALTLLWIGLRFFNKLLSIKNTFVYLVMCKIPRTEANFLLGTSQIRRTVVRHPKNRPHIQAHLVFQLHKSKAKNQKSLNFPYARKKKLQKLNRRNIITIFVKIVKIKKSRQWKQILENTSEN